MNRLYSKTSPSPHGDITRYINVRTNFIGFHQYDNAPDQVAFLKNNHRHRFHVTVQIEVSHDDRELEFFMVQEMLDRDIVPFLSLTPLGSCEMIAEDIIWGLINAYGSHRYFEVNVSEDGESDGVVTWTPHS